MDKDREKLEKPEGPLKSLFKKKKNGETVYEKKNSETNRKEALDRA